MEIKSYKMFMIVVSVLIVINCILLGMFWFKKDGRLGGKNGPPPRANEYLTKELNLTLAQEKKYDVLRIQHFEFTRKLNEQSRKLHDEFFENIKTPVLDTAKAFTIQRKIATIQTMLDTATLNHFRKFRMILDEDQKNKFDKIIQNALHLMGQQRPGPGGRGPNGMPPPPNGGPGQGPPPDGMPPPN
jgi:Spy/CpxP family protein refolding chaperone